MRRVLAGLAIVATMVTMAGCGHPTITTADGWILPDTGTVTRCVNDGDATLCTDTATGKRYLDGVPVYR